MSKNINDIIAKELMKRLLSNIENEPERVIRNVIDYGLEFSNGRISNYILKHSQLMLEKEHTPYNQLIRNIARNVNRDSIMHFGINIGYNGFIKGADIIRSVEKTKHFNIPFTISFQLDEANEKTLEKYDQIISDCKKLGIYIFSIQTQTKDNVTKLFSLLENHTDCAFFIFATKEQLTTEFMHRLQKNHHVMLVLQYDNEIDDIIASLKQKKVLFSLSMHYTSLHDTFDLEETFFKEEIEPLEPIFVFMITDLFFDKDKEKHFYNQVKRMRHEQKFTFLIFDMKHDTILLDSLLSDDGYYVLFDEEGFLTVNGKAYKKADANIVHKKIKNILQAYLPKGKQDKQKYNRL